MKAPFPWFGGKRRVAPVVWERFGNVAVYCEPFFGSGAVLLNRPGWTPDVGWIETINDLDGFVANAWRAILHDPEATAHAADWIVAENDLHARHAWLVEQRAALTSRLEGDPDWYDAKIAGWWLWGIACWIGSGWCAGTGPWVRTEVEPGDWRLTNGGRGGSGVDRKRVQLGHAGRGVNRKLVHLGDAGQGGDGECGLVEWLRALSDRLRRVRVCCGDWRRVLTPSALQSGGSTGRGVHGIFLDPPYSAEAGRDMGCYATDSGTVTHEVRAWCVEYGVRKDYRIALCGYEGEGHEEMEALGWSVHAWCAKGGMSNDRGAGSGGNNERERIWFSPGCLSASQASLFG